MKPKTLLPWLTLAVTALAFGAACSDGARDGDGSAAIDSTPFWLGNTHTHSLWSDGDAAPAWISHWYKERGYHFLVLSDHNILSTGDKWFPISQDGGGRLQPEQVMELRQMFGAEAVVTRRDEQGADSMRLTTLPELRQRFEEEGSFLFMQGEEITDGFDRANVHVNAFPLDEVIRPQKGASLIATLQNNFDAVHAHAAARGAPVIAHLNHPNFTWSLTWKDFAAIRGERFFEVYNGHPSVNNQGDLDHPSTETMWDLVNTARLRDHSLPLLFGLATDDAHHYHRMAAGRSNPGRGWIWVRAADLQEAALVQALDAGDFYGSSGVKLRGFRIDDAEYALEIEGEEGVHYRTEFIGTRGREIGVVLSTSESLTPSYRYAGDELFVRAKVTSDRAHPNPSESGDMESAWLQPHRGAGD